jgi:hypothetical protein
MDGGKLATPSVVDLAFFVNTAKAVSGYVIVLAVLFKQQSCFANFLSHPTNSKYNQ